MPRAPPAIASREDVVRPYNPSTDTQMVKMLVGQGVMEGLAYANQRGLPLSPSIPSLPH
jgi:hypothetical protein